MLTIRRNQMAALEAARLAAFFERARAFIGAQLHRTITLAEIETLYERGKTYGLKSEQDFVRYMFVAAAAGAATSTADPDWMRAILEVPTPVNDLKLWRLFEEARSHVPPGIALGSEP